MKHNIIIEFAELSEIPLEGVVNIANELKKRKIPLIDCSVTFFINKN